MIDGSVIGVSVSASVFCLCYADVIITDVGVHCQSVVCSLAIRCAAQFGFVGFVRQTIVVYSLIFI